MRRIRIPCSALSAALAIGVTFALAYGCNSTGGGGPAAPQGGGGGGGGGTTINSGVMPPGASFSFTFNTAGTVNYRCGIHPQIMTGNQVIVSDTSSVDSAVVNILGTFTPGFGPSTVTIKTGGTVRWVNTHTVNHSVESL